MKIIIPNVFFTLFFLCLTSTTFANDCYVNVSGTAFPCGDITSPCATIQACLQSVNDSSSNDTSTDTIYIFPGQYTDLGNCDITTAWIRLVAYPEFDVTPQGQVNISCDQMARHIHITNVPDEDRMSYFKGITFTNGNSENDTANFGRGGSLLLTNGSAEVYNCTFIDCTATTGGAITVLASDRVLIYNSTFIGNSAIGAGGVYASRSTTIDSCVFSNNMASAGGAMYYTGGNVYRSNFTGNYGYRGIMMIFVRGPYVSNSGVISNCIFDSNTGYRGGGISVDQTSFNIRISDCNFTRNIIDGFGGGLDLNTYNDYDITLKRCLFQSNIAENGAGMYIYTSVDSYLASWHDNVVIDNIATDPDYPVGGVFFSSSYDVYYGISLGNMLLSNNSPSNFDCAVPIAQVCKDPECTSLSCDTCQGICVTENITQCFEAFPPENPCIHGACTIDNSTTTTCACEGNWDGDFCDYQPVPVVEEGPLVTQWYLWVGVFAGVLLIVFIAVTIYSKTTDNGNNNFNAFE